MWYLRWVWTELEVEEVGNGGREERMGRMKVQLVPRHMDRNDCHDHRKLGSLGLSWIMGLMTRHKNVPMWKAGLNGESRLLITGYQLQARPYIRFLTCMTSFNLQWFYFTDEGNKDLKRWMISLKLYCRYVMVPLEKLEVSDYRVGYGKESESGWSQKKEM